MPTQAATAGKLERLEPPVSLVDMIARQIFDAILNGTFAANERIVETKVARDLGVSRIPLREALKKLESEGLVTSTKGRGTFVAAPSHADFAEMIPVRANLEGLAARLFVVRSDRDAVAELRRMNHQLHKAAATGDIPTCREAGWAYHKAMVQLCGNAALFAAWRSLSDLVRLFMHQADVYLTDIDLVLAVHDHFTALLAGNDPSRAEHQIRGLLIHFGFDMVGRSVPDGLADIVADLPTQWGES